MTQNEFLPYSLHPLDTASIDIEDEQIDAHVRSSLFAVPVAPVRLGRHKILRRLGHGGMGVVYSAYDEELDRKVAIKLVRGMTDEATRARSLREAQALAKLTHPNVVGVYDVGTQGTDVWIAMEFVAGRTLSAWAREQHRTWRDVLRVSTEVARGIAAAHAAGLVHRDLKPDNVMIGNDERARVLDFGLADTVATETGHGSCGMAEATPQTQPGVVRGTPAYMAPEHLMGCEVDAAADQFGWSVMTWELLYGERPFIDTEAVLAGRRSPRPPGAKVPVWLSHAVERGLAVNPEERHANMSAVLAALAADPTRRRWMLTGILVLLALLSGWIGVREFTHRRVVTACIQAGSYITQSWNENAQARLRDSLITSGVSFAAETAERIIPQLDTYADSWSDARYQLCIAESRISALDHEQAAQAEACLDEARQYLDSLLEVLSSADSSRLGKSIAQNAVSAVSLLPQLAKCDNGLYLRSRPPLPQDPETREEVRRIRGVLAKAHALSVTGDTPLALERSEEASRDAKALDWPPLQAAADLLLGRLLRDLAQHEAAEEMIRSAFFASGAVREDAVHLEAAIALVSLAGQPETRHDERLHWAQMAKMLLDRENDSDSSVHAAQLFRNLGLLYSERGDYEESVVMHEKALYLHQREYGLYHPTIGSDLSNLADSHRMNGDLQRALAHGLQALKVKEHSLGKGHPSATAALGNLGAIYIDMRDHEKALETTTHVLRAHEKEFGPNHPILTISLNNLGNIYHRLEEPVRGIEVLTRALSIGQNTLGEGHPRVATTRYTLGLIYADQGMTTRALDLYESARLGWETALGSEHPLVGDALNAMSNAHGDLGDFAAAVDGSLRALTIMEDLGQDHERVQTVQFNVGNWLMEDGQTERARPYLERALRYWEQHPDDRGILGRTRFCLARALWPEPDQRQRALQLARMAFDDLSRSGPKNAEDAARAGLWLSTHDG